MPSLNKVPIPAVDLINPPGSGPASVTPDAEGNLLFQLKAYMIQSLMVRSNV